MIGYVDRSSAVHRVDPRLKIAWSLVISLLAVAISHPAGLAVVFLVSVLPWFFFRPPMVYLRVLLVLAGAVVLGSMISQGFFYPFHPRTELFTLLPGCSCCREGLCYGAVQSFRLLAILAAGMLVIFTTHPAELILAMTTLRVPHAFAFMLTLALRFLPEVIEQTQRILLAQQLRGVTGNGVVGAWRRFRLLIVPLLAASLHRARQVAIAAEVRAYSPARVPRKALRFSRSDCSIAVALLALTVYGLFAVCSACLIPHGGGR